MKKLRVIFLFIFISIPFICFPQDPTKWRGPNQNGYYPDTGLLTEWPDGGPEILWQYTKLGEGYSSPAFGNDRIYVSGMEGQTGYVYALEEDGKLLWKAPYGKEFYSSYPGSRGTPVIDGDKLFVLSGMGHLSCLSSNSGQVIWRKDLFKDFGGRNTEWGLAETLLIHDDMLICTPGGREHNVIALNKTSGDLIWSIKGRGEIPAYCSPLLVNVGGRNLMVTHTRDNILGIDADSGKLLWSHGHTNRYSVHPNTPLYHEGQLFCFSGYGKGGPMLKLNEDGSKVTELWFCGTMNSRMGGAVLMDGHIIGSGDSDREWQSIDWNTGKVKYETKEVGNGVVIAAEGLLYLYSQRGELALMKPESSSFRLISKTRVSAGSGQHWAHPVIDNGRLFVRHGNALIAYKIK
jgi:outer membrane protein assembly factor BamB